MKLTFQIAYRHAWLRIMGESDHWDGFATSQWSLANQIKARANWFMRLLYLFPEKP